MEREELLSPSEGEATSILPENYAPLDVVEETAFESLLPDEKEAFTNLEGVDDFLKSIIKADKSTEKGDTVEDILNQLAQQDIGEDPAVSSSGKTPKDKLLAAKEAEKEKKDSPRAIPTGKVTIPRPPAKLSKEPNREKEVPRGKQIKNQSSSAVPSSSSLTNRERNKRVLESSRASRALPALSTDTIIKKSPPFPSSDAVSDTQMNNISEMLQGLSARISRAEEFPSALLSSVKSAQEKATCVQNDISDIKQTVEKLREELNTLATLVSRLANKVNVIDSNNAISQGTSAIDTVDLGHVEVDQERSRAAARVNEASKPVTASSSLPQPKAAEVAKRFKVRKF